MPSPSSRICSVDGVRVAPALDADGRVRRRIFGGIVEEIEQHLLEQHGVEREHRQVGRELDLDAMLRQDLAGALQRAADDLAEVVQRGVGHDRAGFELGHVEQVGDEAVEPLGLVDDGRQQLGLGGVVERAATVAQRPGRAEDRGERRLEIVRDRGQQRRAQPLGLRSCA